ncbi:hypothetical protein WMY93_028843 [Mugilogobius chulae]|uniref:Uncharacterized protein n=1 Tax=Mugilogobius chulae TaxID=88201 RepID=A0AAW0N0J1_9GOBI
MEPALTSLPLSQDALFSCHRAPHFPSAPLGAPYPLMSRCNSSTLLTNLGLRYGPSRAGPLRGLVPPSCVHSGSRPYRSMENLNWSPVIDPNLTNHCYRSVDSEFILRYTSTSHWYDGPPDAGALSTAHSLNPESFTCTRATASPGRTSRCFLTSCFPEESTNGTPGRDYETSSASRALVLQVNRRKPSRCDRTENNTDLQNQLGLQAKRKSSRKFYDV